MNKILDFFKRIIFFFERPGIIVITGKGKDLSYKAVLRVLEKKPEKRFLVFQSDLKTSFEFKKFKFLLRFSKKPILLVTHFGDIPSDRYSFSGKRKEIFPSRKLAEILPPYGVLILNFDDEKVREIGTETMAKVLTFGFQERADLKADDITSINQGINFKVSYQGDIVPFWLKEKGKEQVYSALSAICLGIAVGVNLVEVSQSLMNKANNKKFQKYRAT